MYAPGGENKFNQEELASANSSVMSLEAFFSSVMGLEVSPLPPSSLILVCFNQALYLRKKIKWLWVLINYLLPKIDELLQPAL